MEIKKTLAEIVDDFHDNPQFMNYFYFFESIINDNNPIKTIKSAVSSRDLSIKFDS